MTTKDEIEVVAPENAEWLNGQIAAITSLIDSVAQHLFLNGYVRASKELLESRFALNRASRLVREAKINADAVTGVVVPVDGAAGGGG